MTADKAAKNGPLRKAVRTTYRAVRKLKKNVITDLENGSRRDIMEQMFYDFNKSRVQVYWANFFRGIFFGVGSVLGGTVVVALIVSILSLFADIPGVFGDFIQYIVTIVHQGRGV